MDPRKRRRSTYGPEPRPPKRRSPMAPDNNQQQLSVPSSSLDLDPSQTYPANPRTLQTSDNNLHDWHDGAYVVAHGTTTSSGDSCPLSSVTMLPGLSYSHPHLYSSPPSQQVLPADPQALQSRDIPHDWRSKPVGPDPGVPGPAPALGPSGDPWKLWMPSPIRATGPSVSDSQSHASASSLQNYATSSQTPSSNIHHDRRHGSPGSYLQYSQIAPPRSPAGDLPSFQLPRMEVTHWRSNPNSSSQSSTPVPGSSVPTTPAPSSPAHSDQSLSSPSSLSHSETPCASPNPWSPYDNNARVRAQLGSAGINAPVPSVSEPTPSSSAGPSDGKKKSIISATRLILQTASTALRFSPIPFLPNIPDLLLMLLQVYENVSGNNEALKGLSDDVQNAYNTILRPLQLWTGQIPPEVIFPLKELHLALEDQVKRITSLESQNRKPLRKIFKAGSLMQSMNGVRTCISEALSRFATVATTLNLLNTIQVSVDYELSKLPKVNAEYYRVESKSECLKTTRDKIRGSILEYLRDPKNRFVWLRGSPGTGKTAISMSVASTLDKQHTLAASFFWDKNQEGTGLDSISRFPSTLARQLAAFNAEYQNSLIRQLRDPASFSSIDGSPLEKEVKARIINPMRELGGVLSSGKGRPVIVLDGLDECGNPEALASLMRLVLLLDELPSTFAILVSCRPEPQVISAWARATRLSIAHEDMDQIAEDENFHTIRCMVEKGLQDCIMESPWKPTKKDLDAFSSACRGLPIIASTRIRDVHVQTQSGSTLESEFDYYLNLTDAPQGLNEEYLRIMRRAYLRQYPKMNSRIAEKYREVVGMIIAARKGLSVCDISQLLRTFTEHEVHSTLKPISSIVNLPSKNKRLIKFYHATVKEFITGNPIGKEEDKVFFISDKNGYSFGLRLLQLVNGAIQRNEWGLRDMKRGERDLPNYVYYAFKHLFQHLDPLLLFSEEPNELQREYEQFWKQNLLSFFGADGGVIIPHNWSKNHKSTSVICAAISLFGVRSLRVVYRSKLPFTPTSSPLYEFYAHLSPVRVFSVSGEFAGGFIPLSEDAHRARKAMEAELPKLPKVVNKDGEEVINYEAEFLNDNVHNGIVTCAALSRDGHHIALGFGSGIIEITNIDNQCTISRFQNNLPYPPVWIEFIRGGNTHIATEDTHGNVTILGNGTPSVKLGPLPCSHYPPVTVVSDNGSFIVRVPRNAHDNWYMNTAVLRVSGNSSIQLLTPPTLSSWSKSNGSFTLQHSWLGFSPRGRYVCASDGHIGFGWSTDSGEFIAEFQGIGYVVINTGIVPSCPFLTLNATFHQPTFPSIPEEDTQPVSKNDSDESWLECPFYGLSPGTGLGMHVGCCAAYSSAVGKVPFIDFSFIAEYIWFNGKHELSIPSNYCAIVRRLEATDDWKVWYGDRTIYSNEGTYNKYPHWDRFYFPQASKDGTRFLIQGKMKAPIIVDISKAVQCPN